MSEEREIFGEQYSFRRMPARDQLPVVLRLFRASKSAESEDATFMDLFTTMSDEDARFMMDHCLRTVNRRQGQNWVPISNGAGGGMMFDDIEDNIMLQIDLVAAVLEINVRNFSRAAPPSSPNESQSPG